jgi:Flp pilus assembly pilin Flp
MSPKATFRELLRKVHRDERGAVSLETILIIGAIAIPILIFLIKFGWPRIRDYFNQGLDQLEEGSNNAAAGGGRL